jgi:hypothetical protein
MFVSFIYLSSTTMKYRRLECQLHAKRVKVSRALRFVLLVQSFPNISVNLFCIWAVLHTPRIAK